MTQKNGKFSSATGLREPLLTTEFADVIPDIFTVFTDADDIGAMTTPLPLGFHEPEASRLLALVHKLPSQAKNPTTMQQRIQEHYYTTPYQIYHDLTVVCARTILHYPLGLDEYFDVDFYYRFCVEVLLRELTRLHMQMGPVESEGDQLELQAQLLEDFTLISLAYRQGNNETISYIHEEEPADLQSPYAPVYQPSAPPRKTVQPLFLSLLGKSQLDPRPTVVGGDYTISKVVALNRVGARGVQTMDAISPGLNRIPNPLEARNSLILNDFFHPTWYTIPIPSWLTYKGTALKPPTALPNAIALKQDANGGNKRTTLSILQRGKHPERTTTLKLVDVPGDLYRLFAPVTDLGDAIITGGFKAGIWLQHLGWKRIQEIKQATKEGELALEEKDADEDKEKSKETLPPPPWPLKYDEPISDEVMARWKPEPVEAGAPIDVAALVNWDPARITQLEEMKRDRNDITKLAASLQRLILINLLRLNKLRNQRYRASDPRLILPPGDEEKNVYHRTAKLLTFAIEAYKLLPGDFDVKFSRHLPVLTEEFGGVLPGAMPLKPSQYPVSGNRRVPNIRGPYRKKNRAV